MPKFRALTFYLVPSNFVLFYATFSLTLPLIPIEYAITNGSKVGTRSTQE